MVARRTRALGDDAEALRERDGLRRAERERRERPREVVVVDLRSLHYITLHYITSHGITLHYITFHHRKL